MTIFHGEENNPLVMADSLLLKPWPIEIVDLPSYKKVIFHDFPLRYVNVSLPKAPAHLELPLPPPPARWSRAVRRRTV